MSHVAHMNESCRTNEWVMSHMWMSHDAHMNESCRTYEWVMSHKWMSHVAHTNESCCTYEWDMSHIWGSCHTHDWWCDTIYMSPRDSFFFGLLSHDTFMISFICATWLIYVLFKCLTHIHTQFFSLASLAWHTYEIIYMRDMTHSCVIYMCDPQMCYRVATISRLLKIIGLFCRI